MIVNYFMPEAKEAEAEPQREMLRRVWGAVLKEAGIKPDDAERCVAPWCLRVRGCGCPPRGERGGGGAGARDGACVCPVLLCLPRRRVCFVIKMHKTTRDAPPALCCALKVCGPTGL
jgi:hypothetical protein